ncbi:MAG: MBL fold metallo-hydrolase [Verrucomicrobia bacterium]|nr:MBL fold metallo-hydrolase [Verrucomicrobiota bacterium]
MNLHVLPAGPIQTNAYLLTAPERGEAVLIDAPGSVWPDVEPILAAEKCRLTELWLTHGHWDHMQGGDEVVRASGARTTGHAADQAMFESPQMMERFMGQRLGLQPVKIERWVKPGDTLAALGREFEVRHVPGHCPGNVAFYCARAGAVFVGDALFAGSIGRTDLPGGSFEQLEQSIRAQLYTLPDATAVYPGHGPATTIGEEKENNPYVSG